MSHEPIPCKNCILLPICLTKVREYINSFVNKKAKIRLYQHTLTVADKLAKNCSVLDNQLLEPLNPKRNPGVLCYSRDRMVSVGIYILQIVLSPQEKSNGEDTM